MRNIIFLVTLLGSFSSYALPGDQLYWGITKPHKNVFSTVFHSTHHEIFLDSNKCYDGFFKDTLDSGRNETQKEWQPTQLLSQELVSKQEVELSKCTSFIVMQRVKEEFSNECSTHGNASLEYSQFLNNVCLGDRGITGRGHLVHACTNYSGIGIDRIGVEGSYSESTQSPCGVLQDGSVSNVPGAVERIIRVQNEVYQQLSNDRH